MDSTRHYRRAVPAQSLVEFALVLPLLMLNLMIVMDFGRAVWYHNAISNSVREGARYAIVVSRTDAQIRGHIRDKSKGVRLADSDIAIIPSVVRTPRQPVTVIVTHRFQPLTPLIGDLIGDSLTLRASSRMLVEY